MGESDSDGSARGPDPNVSRERIASAIRGADKLAVTAPEIANTADLTNKTVYKHIEAVVGDNDDIHSDDIGGSTVYWAEETATTVANTGGGRPPERETDENEDQTAGLATRLKHGISTRAKHHPVHTWLIAAGVPGYFISILGIMGTFALAPPNFTKFLGFFIMFGLLAFSMAVVPAAHLFYLRLTTLAQHATLLKQATDGVEQ